MMTVKSIYQYVFYKFYKLSEAAPSKWWSDWKAVIAMMTLELWFIMAVVVYIIVFTDARLPNDKLIALVGGGLIVFLTAVKYVIFFRHARWKSFISEFDSWPKRKNTRGTICVGIMVFFIVANLIYSFYLLANS